MLRPQAVPRTKGVTTRDLFLFLSQKLRAQVRHDGLDLKLFVNLTLPHFATLKTPEQEKAIWHISTLIELCKFLQSEGKSIADSRALTAAFLRSAGVNAPAGFIETIQPNDYIEIHNDQEQLAFLTLPFVLQANSLSLEEVFCLPWGEIFGRARPYLADKFFEVSKSILAGEHQGVVNTAQISNQQGLELARREKLARLLVPQVMAPLFDSQAKIAGYLCVSRLESLS